MTILSKSNTFEKKGNQYTNTANSEVWQQFTGIDSGHLHISNGGKFLIIADHNIRTSNANVVLWRLDLADSSLHKILDVPKDRPIFEDHPDINFDHSLSTVAFVSNKYAYFAAKDILFRVDVQTGDLKLVFKVPMDPVDRQPSDNLARLDLSFIDKNHIAIMTSPRGLFSIFRRIRILRESSCEILHVVESNNLFPAQYNFQTQFALLKEGVICKYKEVNFYQRTKIFENCYILHSYKDLKPVTKHTVDNSCQYSKDWFSINYFRLWGFPVFIESVFIDTKNSYHFSLSILFKSRFHQLTTPCPIDMRYKKITNIQTVIQPDPKLTELIVEVSGLTRYASKSIFIMTLKL